MNQTYGIGVQFPNAASLYHAAEKVRDRGYNRWDVFSPFPIHGMDDAMGLGRSKLSLISLLGGISGLALAFFMIYYISYDYPMNVHGKPYFSFEASVPVFFELTILLTAFASLFAVLGMNLLPRWNHPVFNWDRFSQVTNDGFFIVIEAADPLFSQDETTKFLQEIGGKNIEWIKKET